MGRHIRRRPPHLRRPQCIPPAMLRNPADRLEGDSILREAPEGWGVLLWRTARDATLWGETPPSARGDLFSEGTATARAALLDTDLPGRLSESIRALHGLLCDPVRADASAIAQRCLEIAGWAHEQGLQHAAMAFAQAAALTSPTSGDATLRMGIYARAAGQDVRAETWLRRTVAVARRQENRGAYCTALVELGALYETRDTMARAERLYRFAFTAARYYSARAVRTRAAHALFRFARQRGDEATAVQFAMHAQHALQPEIEGAAEFLIDLARFWTAAGRLKRARTALRRLAPALGGLPKQQQLAALALTALVRAVSGQEPGADAANAAWTLLADGSVPDSDRYSAALDLAHAARIAGDLPAFRRAQRALLRLAPQTDYPAVAERIARMWPDAEKSRRKERAS